jgi:hypothetical protein
MQLDELRMPDRFRALSLAKRLFDISSGRLLTTAGIEQDVARWIAREVSPPL